jgi:hypothetical protein
MTHIIHVDQLRNTLPPLRNWDECFTLYYDETNNIRRMTLTEVGINAPENKTFVLAGVVLAPDQSITDISELRNAIRLQTNAPELKFKHVADGNYERSLGSQRLHTFLTWLLDQEILIHYSSLNVMYWSLIDIIDSLMGDDIRVQFHHMELKSTLYSSVCHSPAEFMKLLHSFSYPNIERNSVAQFIASICRFLDQHGAQDNEEEIRFLKSILENALEIDELVFLHDNSPGELISDFSLQFLHRVCVFKNSTHIFDRETYVESILQNTALHSDSGRLDYQFADSKSEVCIQLSDVITGLLGKHFTYIQDHTLNELMKRKAAFSVMQLRNLALLKKHIDRSDAVSDGFCHTIGPLETINKNNVFLHEL